MNIEPGDEVSWIVQHTGKIVEVNKETYTVMLSNGTYTEIRKAQVQSVKYAERATNLVKALEEGERIID